MPAASFLLSNSTSGLFHSGLGYHVSGTSKSLAELSEMLPGGRGQNKVNKERTTPGGEQKDQLQRQLRPGPGGGMATSGESPRVGLAYGEQCPANRGHTAETSQQGQGSASLLGCLS